MAAAAAALAIVFGMRAEVLDPGTGVALLIGAGSLILIGAAISASRRLDDEAVARRIDRASGLADRLSTAIAFQRALAASGAAAGAGGPAAAGSSAAGADHAESIDLMLAAIRDGERAAPRADVRAAAPFAAPRDWRAALGFLAVSALAAGLALPSVDRAPRLLGVDPPKARPGEEVTLVGERLTAGAPTPVAGLPPGVVLGAPGVPPGSLALEPHAALGRAVFLGASENPFELERQMREIAAGFAEREATRPLAQALAAGDVERVTGEVARLGAQLAPADHQRIAAFGQLATRLANNRGVAVLEWTAERIRVRIPADAAHGPTTLTAYVGRHTAGPVAFEVLDPRDEANFQAGAVLLEPDERAYVDRILAELRMVARRDDVPELEEFANKIEQLLKDAEEGKVTKEKLLEALRKAEEVLNQGREPDGAEIDKQLGELGKELAKSELTKELGQALQQNDLAKAKQELEELARKLDPKEREQQLEELQKQLAEQEQREREREELQKKLEELQKQLADKDKQLTEEQKQELQKQMEQLQKQLQENAKQQLDPQRKQELQKQLEQMKSEKPLTEQQKEQLQKQLEQTAKQMQQQQKAQEQKAQQQQQKLEDEIRRLQKEKDQAKTEREKLDAERRLEKKRDELKQLQKQEEQRQQSAQRDAIKRLQKDLEQAAESLEKPKSKEETEQEQEMRERQASQKLKDAARETGRVDSDKRKQAAQRKLSTQMDDLREAMQRAKQKGNKGPQDPFNKRGKNQDFAQRARGQKGSGQAWRPGQGQGQGQGQSGQGQNGQGQGQGGSTWGTGTGPDLAGDPTQKSGNTKDADLTGKQGDKGGSRRETILAAAQKGFASRAYKDVYTDYEKIVEEVMRNEKLPSSYKYYVKRYFAKIHPEAGLDVESAKPAQ